MTTHGDSGLGTPPFGTSRGQDPSGYPAEYSGPRYTPADFPAPVGVPPVMQAPPPALAPNRRRRTLPALVAAASLSAVIGAGAGIGSYAYLDQGGRTTASPVSVTTVPASSSPALDGTVSAAAAKIERSVVTISLRTGRGGSVGTGVVLDTEGHILTNAHVVDGAGGSQITVTFDDGTTATATLVGSAETSDLAVIKVAGVDNLTPAVFAKSSSVRVGQTVVAVGAPLGLSDSVTSGVVSSTARPVRSGTNNDAVYLAVQTDAAINPGNSGGPLVDLNGAVVGINSSIATTGGSDGSGQSGNIGIGFAISADIAVRVAGDLIAQGTSKNAAMGVRVTGTDSDLTTGPGVALDTVMTGSAAEKAGLRAGDVVTKVNEFRAQTADALIAATRFYAPGTTVTVTYNRDGETRTVEVTLGSS